MTESTDTSQEIPYRSELQRKFLHLLALIIPILIVMLGKKISLMLLIPLSGVALAMEVARVRSPRAASLIHGLFGGMMRKSEMPPIGSPIALNGATWVMISATVLTILFPIDIACSSLAMFMLGDAAAALIGRKLGRTHWPHSKKTLEGSLGFFIVSGLTLQAFGVLSWYETALVAFIAALLEVIPIPINDNIRVPLLVASLLFVLERYLWGMDVSLFF